MDIAIPQYSAHVHVTPGRLRVKSLLLKRNEVRARRAEFELAGVPNITFARVNATTGSITLYFDPAHWTAAALIALLRERGYVADLPAEQPSSCQPERDMLAECFALIGKELLSTVISRIFPHPLVTTLLAVV
jgi:hypothetical protein